MPLEFQLSPHRWEEVRSVPERPFPVVVRHCGRRLAALLRVPLPRVVSGVAQREQGVLASRRHRGAMLVEVDDTQPVDLSDLFRLGLVRPLILDAAHGGIALAAVPEHAGATRLTILEAEDGGGRWDGRWSRPLWGERDRVSLHIGDDRRLYVAHSLLAPPREMEQRAAIGVLALPQPRRAARRPASCRCRHR